LEYEPKKLIYTQIRVKRETRFHHPLEWAQVISMMLSVVAASGAHFSSPPLTSNEDGEQQ